MDDFSIVGDSFDRCLSNLAEAIKKCEDCNRCYTGRNVTLW